MHPRIPSSLNWLRAEPSGSEWLAALPTLVDECVVRWGLRLGEPFEGHVAFVAPGLTASGEEIVLKINFPSPESESEAAALRHWGGHGAVSLLDADDERRALLLERCVPGTSLWTQGEDDATRALVHLFPRLWERPAPPGAFVALRDAVEVWRQRLSAAYAHANEPFEAELLDEALSFMAAAEGPRPDDVVLHQDLHGGNVLRRSEEWVVIDPKPLVGERAFDLASYVRDRRPRLAEDPAAAAVVRARIDVLSRELDLDRARVRGWALAHALAWGFDASGDFYPNHLVAARLIARS